ncbi:arginase [Paenibacillus albiflavus]|uniref:Arginase n=1 Tax=Paenibacillus albiflavus TaxID=2545760 RepID=A0A4R4ECT6_9BACL|nr:arginase [Paenibacillus albiflavus]TCZ77764.1 arginase [Paenibacillus albiflavus]
MTNNIALSLVSVKSGVGAGRLGAELGPDNIIQAGLIRRLNQLGYTNIDDLQVSSSLQQAASQGTSKAKNREGVIDVCRQLSEQVDESITKGNFPLILGGDHSIAMGSIAGLTKHYKNLGVIWFDAHTDINTEESSPTGNMHGMPLAVALGRAELKIADINKDACELKPENIVIIGARDLDQAEKEIIRSLGITCFTMHEIDRMGMGKVMEEALRIVQNGTDGVHLSFDLDSVDPQEAPGTGTPVPGGVSYREAHFALELMYESGLITSAEFVEVNPTLDINNKTTRLTIELISSLLGKRIL